MLVIALLLTVSLTITVGVTLSRYTAPTGPMGTVPLPPIVLALCYGLAVSTASSLVILAAVVNGLIVRA